MMHTSRGRALLWKTPTGFGLDPLHAVQVVGGSNPLAPTPGKAAMLFSRGHRADTKMEEFYAPQKDSDDAGMTRKIPATLFQSPLRFSCKFLRAPQVFPGYPYADAAPPRAIGEGCESADGK
jgi:hypothetical protein